MTDFAGWRASREAVMVDFAGWRASTEADIADFVGWCADVDVCQSDEKQKGGGVWNSPQR